MIISAIVIIAIVIGALALFLWDYQKPNITLTLSNSIVTFPNKHLEENVTIGPEDIQAMTDSELLCYSSLIYLIERFHMTQDETYYIGRRLLPRFFQQQQTEEKLHE